MPRGVKKEPQIVTFKADPALLDSMRGIENRSQFIRAAVLAALENVCPLCKGSGILTPRQKEHWVAFAADHELTECNDCHEMHLICRSEAKRRRTRLHE